MLALRYRPRRFVDVIGQGHVTAVLRAMLRKGALPAGFIFAGSRGTGKTTTARILAAVLNCGQRSGEEPCGECQSCREVAAGVSVSVIEVDAASNGLVDDVRRLREIASYAHPGEWRVFILDEAHSMSREAFNALLKILEEPPARTLWILATTEPDRVPETVRSRLMGFEFRRLSDADIVGRLRYVLEAEGIEYEPEVLPLIAHRVEGGMRDALMAVDQLRHFSEKVTVAAFKEFFGVVDRSVYEELTWAVVKGDAGKAAHIVEEYFNRASEGLTLVDGLMAYYRDLLLIKQGVSVAGVSPALVESVALKVIMDWLAVLWDLRVKVRHTGSGHRVLTDVGVVMLMRAAGKTVADVKAAGAAKVLSSREEVSAVLAEIS